MPATQLLPIFCFSRVAFIPSFCRIGVLIFPHRCLLVAAFCAPAHQPHTQQKSCNPYSHSSRKPPKIDTPPKVQSEQYPGRNAPLRIQQHIYQQTKDKTPASLCSSHILSLKPTLEMYLWKGYLPSFVLLTRSPSSNSINTGSMPWDHL